MEKVCKQELCNGCGACAAVCTAGCIQMLADAEGFLRPVIRPENCIDCNRCQRVCPVLAQENTANGTTVAYAAIHTDADIRYGSTSGGVFSLLCQWIFERGGIVYGAAYDEKFDVVHCPAENMEQVHKLRGAKYAQSYLNDCYTQVRRQLEAGRYVLFSGTPCQVGGLRAYLGKDYEKLLLVDLICHGVPSPKVWQHYIAYRSIQDAQGEKPAAINLRSKETGWPRYSIRFDYPSGQFYSAYNFQDPYLRGFVGNLCLRPSCYDCRFKGDTRISDFTLGDYWGVWDQRPEYHDEKGTSLVLLHTEKAKQCWEQIAGQLKAEQVDVQEALKDNPSALESSKRPSARELFFACYENEDFLQLITRILPVKKEMKKTIWYKLIRLPYRVAKKVVRLLRK